jgi:DNA-binding NtrC family response regulator
MNAKRSKVWIIDDEPDLAVVYADSLTSDAIDVTIYGSAEEALAVIEQNPNSTDLIVTDFHLPKMNGVTFLQTLRQKLIEKPVILVSGGTDREQLIRASNLTLTGFLQKPFDLAQFRDKILSTLNNRINFDIDAELIGCLKTQNNLMQEIINSLLIRIQLAEKHLLEIDQEKHFAFTNSKDNFRGVEKERRIALEIDQLKKRIENLWNQSTFAK